MFLPSASSKEATKQKQEQSTTHQKSSPKVASWMSFWDQESIKNGSQHRSKMGHRFWDPLEHDFGRFWGCQKGPKWTPNRSKNQGAKAQAKKEQTPSLKCFYFLFL